MTHRIGNGASPLVTGLTRFKDDMKQEAREIADAAKKNGWSLDGVREVSREVKEAGIALGAETVGVAELVGFRYGVSKYEFKVSDGLTRGSRIDDPKAYQTLKDRGFKGIVDLTLEGTLDGQEAPKAGLNALNVAILDNTAPTTAQMKQFLDFATDPANTPCYVHCEAGKGRTGVAVACYRMAVEGWTLDRAIGDAQHFGLSLSNQVEFLTQFAADLRAGKLAGYPKA